MRRQRIGQSKEPPLSGSISPLLKHGEKGKTKLVNYLLDSGSERSLIRTDVADELKLQGPTSDMTVNDVNGLKVRIPDVRRVRFRLIPAQSESLEPLKEGIELTALSLPSLCDDLVATPTPWFCKDDVGNASFPRNLPPKAMQVIRNAEWALRDRSRAGMLAGSMEGHKRRHTGGLQLSQDKDNQISSVLKRGPERNPKPSSRIERSSRERSAGVIRARAVNVKSSACDHRAVQCRLLLFVAEAVVDGRTPSTAANRESIDTTGPNDSTRIDGYANDKLGQPMSGSLKAGELAIYGADLNHRRLPV
ncbi:conserved hypothetical protein [Trichinella spiralis]|uniref:hypothetical protein n=1 Tax=Trichinella spiralis TaxID=6334 RepID=UPI0001EFDE35|nr:conserved hypothetical protein [Trichinella spiralis]